MPDSSASPRLASAPAEAEARPPQVDARTGRPLVSLQEQMESVRLASQRLSADHRLPLDTKGVYARLHQVLNEHRPLFQEWTLEICYLLEHARVLRYGQIKNWLPGISSRTLALKLAHLQDHGMIERTVYDEIPPHVEYRLTPRGRGFTALLFPLLVFVAEEGPK